MSIEDVVNNGWIRAIDEALVMHDIGVANAADTYEQAKHKLNKLLCVVQDIGEYFAKQEPAQASNDLLLKIWDALNEECAGKCNAEYNPCWARQLMLEIDKELQRQLPKEPAQAVPLDSDRVFDDGYLLGLKAGYSFGKSNSEAGEIAYTNAVRAREKLQKEYKSQAVPPAIDDDTKKMVLELCKVVDNYTDIPLTKQIREKLEAGNGE